MLQLLGVSPPQGVHWYKPGACHNARWMVTILYSAKLFAFSDQINLADGLLEKLQRLCIFCALYYAPHWLTSSIGRDASINDLNFWNAMIKFKSDDAEIADVAIAALKRHFWYATEELSPASIFLNKISNQEKSSNTSVSITLITLWDSLHFHQSQLTQNLKISLVQIHG